MISDSASIHPTAMVASGARVGPRTSVGPYAMLGPEVSLGADNVVGAYVVIEGRAEIGTANRFYSHSVIGVEPQVSAWQGGPQRLQIGDHNVFREFVSVSGSADEGHGCTSIGSRNMLMATAHVGHDCQLGDRIHIANGGTLAGRVVIEDNAWVSGLCAVHQLVRIGAHAFAAGGAIVTQDIPPFCLVQGDRARLVSLNEVGLRRADFPDTVVSPDVV